MAAGRVLLVSQGDGSATHVEASGCGVTVKPKVPDIVGGLNILLKNRHQWREMGLAGRRYVIENLNWKKIAKDALKEYRKLIPDL